MIIEASLDACITFDMTAIYQTILINFGKNSSPLCKDY
jgi:hypothetical protein